MTVTVTIDGMSCAHCSARVEKALNALPGVRARVDLAEKKAIVEGESLDETAIRSAISDAGYTPRP